MYGCKFYSFDVEEAAINKERSPGYIFRANGFNRYSPKKFFLIDSIKSGVLYKIRVTDDGYPLFLSYDCFVNVLVFHSLASFGQFFLPILLPACNLFFTYNWKFIATVSKFIRVLSKISNKLTSSSIE